MSSVYSVTHVAGQDDSLPFLPLWEKVARTQSAPDEGYLTAHSVFAERTPHPSPHFVR